MPSCQNRNRRNKNCPNRNGLHIMKPHYNGISLVIFQGLQETAGRYWKTAGHMPSAPAGSIVTPGIVTAALHLLPRVA